MRVLAGTPLHVLNPALQALGLALPNLGDIDRQTISGAIATGHARHGHPAPGHRRCGQRAHPRARRRLDARSARREVEPEVFGAARVGLGALGVVTEVELQCVPAYRLHAKEAGASLTELLPVIQAEADAHRPPRPALVPAHRPGAHQAQRRRRCRARVRRRWPPWRSRLDDDLLANRLLRGGQPAGGAPGPPWCPPSTGSARACSAPGSSPTTRGRCSAPRARCASSRASTPCRGTSVEAVLTELRAWFARTARTRDVPGGGALHRRRRRVALDGVRAGQRLRRRAPVPPDGPAAALRRLRGDRRRARGPAALGQGAHAGRASGCASSTRASTTSARCASGSTPGHLFTNDHVAPPARRLTGVRSGASDGGSVRRRAGRRRR